MKALYIYFFVMIFVMVSTAYFIADSHESAHYQNCIYHGGQAVKHMETFWLNYAYVYCNLTGTEAEMEGARIVDGINEAITYPLQVAILGIQGAMFFIGGLIIFKHDYSQSEDK
jgi:hypothetical protein